ncbi:prolyl-tRNA synthetase [Patescibacteria group bacterium]|nr:prolyl-tRNA synthetase [Patescibacteria group bacterium]
MRQSELFSKTQRSLPKDEESTNAKLLLRSGFVHKETAGVYSFLPLGLKVLNNIISIIREEMNAIGGQEVFLSSLQGPEVWRKSGRWDDKIVDVWFKTKLKNGGELGLANTHEEALTALLSHHVSSYKDLPLLVYQFQTKFRNETRAKSGLMRTREFIMKDLYSFARTLKEHEMLYGKVIEAYKKIFERIGIGEKTLFTFASGGSFSKYSHEFQTLCSAGEDTIYICGHCKVAVNKEIIKEQPSCPQCGNQELKEESAVEVGNIFALGTKYAEILGLEYLDENGKKIPVVMGSYGIGPGRVMGSVVELFHDERGMIWPESIAPFKVHLLSLPGGEEESDKVYSSLQRDGIKVLYDDRANVSPGEKLVDADLFGIPWRVVVSEKTVAVDSVEVKKRNEEKAELIKQKDIAKFLAKNT